MKKPYYLILPNIRSCHNVGAMFRTADAMGVTKLFLVGYTACPPKPQIDKVSLGAETWMPWEHHDSLVAVLDELKKEHCQIVALEKSEKSSPIFDFEKDATRPIALIVGNEVEGVPEEIQEKCDAVVHIPMVGKKESLNVSIAAGIAMYEIFL